MTAKEELGQLYRMKESIDCLIERRQQAQDLAYKITACNDGMPKGSGSGDKISNTAVRTAQLTEEINQKLADYEAMQAKIAGKIGLLKNKDYKLLLELRYLNFNPWHVIAWKINYNERHVYKLHNEALKKYAET